MSTTCLLCPAVAVADGLCVEDGARLWAAQALLQPSTMKQLFQITEFSIEGDARRKAWRELKNDDEARVFLDRVEAARKARPVCPRLGCPGGPDHA